MLLIPFTYEPGENEYKLFVLLEEAQLGRLRAFDPAQIELPIRGWETKRLTLILIGYGDDRAIEHATSLLQSGRGGEALKFLSRGFEFRPDLGDHDEPPVSLLEKPGD